MTAVAWCAIVRARCRCGTTFPALPGIDRTGRCLSCREHAAKSRKRIDTSSPGYRLAAEVATYSAALHLIGIIGERALTAVAGRRGTDRMALQEIVEVAGAAVFGLVHRDSPQPVALPSPRVALDDAPLATAQPAGTWAWPPRVG